MSVKQGAMALTVKWKKGTKSLSWFGVIFLAFFNIVKVFDQLGEGMVFNLPVGGCITESLFSIFSLSVSCLQSKSANSFFCAIKKILAWHLRLVSMLFSNKDEKQSVLFNPQIGRLNHTPILLLAISEVKSHLTSGVDKVKIPFICRTFLWSLTNQI